MSSFTKTCFALAFSASLAASASAQMVVHGVGPAQSCYNSANTGNSGTQSAIRECEDALDNSILTRKDRAATLVNLGVLLMRKGDNIAAQTHYKQAIELRPEIPEAYINYGASLIYSGDYQEAISTTNKAIELDTEKMPEALFNRAIAYDRMENYKGAYEDLKQALLLRPDWEPAIDLMSGYQVRPRAKS